MIKIPINAILTVKARIEKSTTTPAYTILPILCGSPKDLTYLQLTNNIVLKHRK